MKSFRVILKTVDGTNRWIERVDGFSEKDIILAIHQRYGLRVQVIKATTI